MELNVSPPNLRRNYPALTDFLLVRELIWRSSCMHPGCCKTRIDGVVVLVGWRGVAGAGLGRGCGAAASVYFTVVAHVYFTVDCRLRRAKRGASVVSVESPSGLS